MKDFSRLDKAIVERIRGGCRTFHALHVALASVIGEASPDESEDWRVLERRLQSLRKKGVIAFNRAAGWYCER